MGKHSGFNPSFVYNDFIEKIEAELQRRLDIKAYLEQQELDRQKAQSELERLLEEEKRRLEEEEAKRLAELEPKKEWSIKFRGNAVYRTIKFDSNNASFFDIKE